MSVVPVATEPRAQSSALAVTALCLGLGGTMMGFGPAISSYPYSLALGAVAVVLGIVVLAGRHPRPRVAMAAIVVGILSVGLGVIGYYIVQDAIDQLSSL